MTHDPAQASSELQRLIREAAPPSALAELLDALPEPARIAASRSLDHGLQRALYKAVAGFRPIQLADLVPAGTPERTAVRHYGRNTLPAFRLFEKRFYAYTHDGARGVGGANFQSIQWLTGPGYFVVREDAARGELLVDYNLVPPVAPADFPRIAPNRGNRSGLVYGAMIDTLRRVSEHVCIGSAAKNGKAIDSYFTLCRQA